MERGVVDGDRVVAVVRRLGDELLRTARCVGAGGQRGPGGGIQLEKPWSGHRFAAFVAVAFFAGAAFFATFFLAMISSI